MRIYTITNVVSGKVYVGQTIMQKYQKRWFYHRWHLRNNKHENMYLQHSWNKHGEDKFVFDIICVCQSQDELNEQEDLYIKKFKALNLCYNMTDGGRNQTCSDETRAKLRIAAKKNGVISALKLQKSHPGLISPDGIVYDPIVNLRNFCREHKIHRSQIMKMYNGTKLSCQGWTLNNPIRESKRTDLESQKHVYHVFDDLGNEYTTKNLKTLAKELDIPYQSLTYLYRNPTNASKNLPNWRVECKKS